MTWKADGLTEEIERGCAILIAALEDSLRVMGSDPVLDRRILKSWERAASRMGTQAVRLGEEHGDRRVLKRISRAIIF